MIDLTPDQLQELVSEQPCVRDPATGETYVLVRRETYERLRSLLEDSVVATGELVDAVMSEDDAHDPHLGEYQRNYGDA